MGAAEPPASAGNTDPGLLVLPHPPQTAPAPRALLPQAEAAGPCRLGREPQAHVWSGKNVPSWKQGRNVHSAFSCSVRASAVLSLKSHIGTSKFPGGTFPEAEERATGHHGAPAAPSLHAQRSSHAQRPLSSIHCLPALRQQRPGDAAPTSLGRMLCWPVTNADDPPAPSPGH